LKGLATASTASVELAAAYDADGQRVEVRTDAGCNPGRRFTVRGAEGKVLTEFYEPGEPECAGGLVRLRDYVYVNGELVAAVQNASLNAPFIEGLRVSVGGRTELDIYVAEWDGHACRSRGVNVYGRDEG
jgi:hypothetical protein